MHRNGILIFAMLTSAARAFSFPARSLAHKSVIPNKSFFVRSMSSSGGSETSIVDICKDKISKALGTEEVTVTGRSTLLPNTSVTEFYRLLRFNSLFVPSI